MCAWKVSRLVLLFQSLRSSNLRPGLNRAHFPQTVKNQFFFCAGRMTESQTALWTLAAGEHGMKLFCLPDVASGVGGE